MNTRNRFWFVLIGAILGMAIIACSCGSLSSLIPKSTPTYIPPVNQPVTGQEAIPGLAGRWSDPDTITRTTTTPTVTTIAWENGQYVVTSVINPSRGENDLTDSTWSNGVLTWTYCVPNGNCITSVTVSVNGDNLDTTWTDDQGQSGTTTFNRVP